MWFVSGCNSFVLVATRRLLLPPSVLHGAVNPPCRAHAVSMVCYESMHMLLALIRLTISVFCDITILTSSCAGTCTPPHDTGCKVSFQTLETSI